MADQALDVEGLRVLVSGASGGLGSAICMELARAGADVVLGARDHARGRGIANRIHEESGRPAYCVALDLMKPGAAESAVQEAAHVLGGLGTFVHCAGDPVDGRLENWRERHCPI